MHFLKPKKKKPHSALTRRRISESLTGGKLGGQDSGVNPEEAKELRDKVKRGDNFKHQELIDWWRSGGKL